jgi:hypothetical protein
VLAVALWVWRAGGLVAWALMVIWAVHLVAQVVHPSRHHLQRH